ncbi:hypothetical protein ACO0SA_002104 [Hanseniaspora valbyensis]
MGKSNKKTNKPSKTTEDTANIENLEEENEQSYKLNHLFTNVNPLTLLNLATESTSVSSKPGKKKLFVYDRDSYGRTNYYFTITSPDYLKQLFENEDETANETSDNDNEDSDESCEEERREQIETCLSFISSIERYIAQLVIDRMPWDENPLTGRNQEMHKHCLKNVDFKNDIPFCKLKTNPKNDSSANDYNSDGKSLLHQLRKRKSECDKLDLQVFFRDMFATKELIKEQELSKNKNLKKQSIVPFDTTKSKDAKNDNNNSNNNNIQKESQKNNSNDETKIKDTSSDEEELFKNTNARKQEFLNKWSSMSKQQILHFIENYSLLSILVKEGGVSYKVTNETTNSHVGPNYTTNKDFKKSFKVIDRKITSSYKTLDGFMDFPKYVYKSKETFFGKYLLNSNPQELDWDIPQLLDMSFFTNSLITERNLLYSTVWANFMEGLINHYMESEIIPAVERDVCFQLLQPSLKLLYYLKKYDQGKKMKAEEEDDDDEGMLPKIFEPCLKELDDLYMSKNREEQDKRLEKFVSFAEYYIEVYYIPALVMMILENVKNYNVNVINIIDGLGPLFYYIDGDEDKYEDDDDEEEGDDDYDDDVDSRIDLNDEGVGEEEIRKEVEQYITTLIDKKKEELNNNNNNSIEELNEKDKEEEQESSFSDFKLFTLCRIFLLSVENKWL